ncbi:hypothetical protein St11Ph5_00013 [Escherichia phage St11Ph5]|uniref:Uncharacterized protein n=1 Tax=Escherichia phage St11Ph5 TaxID=2047765 RepID=A0A2D2W2V9_9CAUD|nr:hypothetical protein PP767_gp13 [Escherichia phage St11Ph5]ATS92477.1 hypothetical protein St11Ph5_00013 [Escherichia phage St11Ph5]
MMYSTDYGVCPVCNKRKGVANHKKCSRILQKRRNQEEWAKVLENQHKDEFKQMAVKASTQLIRRTNFIEGYQR